MIPEFNLKKYPEGAIRFRTEIPDYFHLDHVTYDSTYSVYGELKEEVPSDMPTSRGKSVPTSIFEDANHMQDLAGIVSRFRCLVPLLGQAEGLKPPRVRAVQYFIKLLPNVFVCLPLVSYRH
jgi:hypothetical protein